MSFTLRLLIAVGTCRPASKVHDEDSKIGKATCPGTSWSGRRSGGPAKLARTEMVFVIMCSSHTASPNEEATESTSVPTCAAR
eukprot:5151635-Heterocapsa_arctica.AAC.1